MARCNCNSLVHSESLLNFGMCSRSDAILGVTKIYVHEHGAGATIEFDCCGCHQLHYTTAVTKGFWGIIWCTCKYHWQGNNYQAHKMVLEIKKS